MQTNAFAAVGLLAPLIVCFVFIPLATVYLLATYLLQPDPWSRIVLSLVMWLTEAVSFLGAALCFSIP